MTKVDAALAALEDAYQNDPERANVLRCARRFKASWVELAEVLTRIKRGGQYKRWGFASFDEYAKGELHLRQETIDKLTMSFSFLQKRAPQVLERDGLSAPIPSYQAVDYLRRVEEQPHAPDDAVRAIRQRVLEEGATAGAVAREYGDAVFPRTPAERRHSDLLAVRNVAKRLRELLGETRVVPKGLASDVAGALDRLLEAVTEQAA